MTVTCPTCKATTLEGGFCAACGHSLPQGPQAPSAPALGGDGGTPVAPPIPDWVAPISTHASATPAGHDSRRPRRRFLVIAAIVVLLVGVGAVVVPRLINSGAPLTAAAAPSSTASPHTSMAATGTASASTSVTADPVTPSPVPATTSIGPTTGPGAVFAGANLTTAGLGPLTIGMSLAALKQGGYVVASSEPCTPAWVANPDLFRDGVTLYAGTNLESIELTSPTYATRSGARVGMTVNGLRILYGANLTIETKNGAAGPFQVPIVRAGDREVVFVPEWTTGITFEASQITHIISRAYSNDFYFACD